MKLLNEKQVAEQFGLALGQLRAMRFRGSGPRFMKIGSSVRYTAEDVTVWLEARYRRSTSDPGGEAGDGVQE